MRKTCGKWKLTGNTIGQGGQAKVLEAIDYTADNTESFAIKILTNIKRKERLDLEISVSKSVYRQGARVIEIIDDYISSDPKAQRPWYVMPIMTPLTKHEISSTHEALKIFKQIVDAVLDLHKKGVTHRDLKPDNIFVVDGGIFLGDLGLCLPLYDTDSQERLTGELERIGSIHYTPPEAFGKNPVSEKQRAFDLYALGKILYQLITKKVLPGFTNPLEPEYNLVNYMKGLEVHTLNLLLNNLLHNNPQIRLDTADYILEKIDSVISAKTQESKKKPIESFKITLEEAASRFAEKNIQKNEQTKVDISLIEIAKGLQSSCREIALNNQFIKEIQDTINKFHKDTLELKFNDGVSQFVNLLTAPYVKTHFGLEPLTDLGKPNSQDFETGLSYLFKPKQIEIDELLLGISFQVKRKIIFISGGIVKKEQNNGYIDFVKNSTFLFRISSDTNLQDELQETFDTTLEMFANQIIKLLK